MMGLALWMIQQLYEIYKHYLINLNNNPLSRTLSFMIDFDEIYLKSLNFLNIYLTKLNSAKKIEFNKNKLINYKNNLTLFIYYIILYYIIFIITSNNIWTYFL